MAIQIERIKADSVVDLAYQRIRGMIEDGDLAPGARLGQGELAQSFGISRTAVREALRRLAGELVVEFETNRGFFVTPFRLDAVVRRLEVRLILEPEIVRFAASTMDASEIAEIVAIAEAEAGATSSRTAHDLSREFHVKLAQGTGNSEFVRTLESLWTGDIGRQLVELRRASSDWQSDDAAEHLAIAKALKRRDGDRAAKLMARHIRAAYEHWQNVAREDPSV